MYTYLLLTFVRLYRHGEGKEMNLVVVDCIGWSVGWLVGMTLVRFRYRTPSGSCLNVVTVCTVT